MCNLKVVNFDFSLVCQLTTELVMHSKIVQKVPSSVSNRCPATEVVHVARCDDIPLHTDFVAYTREPNRSAYSPTPKRSKKTETLRA